MRSVIKYYSSVLLVMLLLTSKAIAQSEECYIWQPDTAKLLKGNVPFNKISVIDKRTDRKNIGYLPKRRRDTEVRMEDEIGLGVTNYLTAISKETKLGNKELLIVLREFRITPVRKGNKHELVVFADLYFQYEDGYKLLHQVRNYNIFTPGRRPDATFNMLNAMFRDMIEISRHPSFQVAEDAELLSIEDVFNHPALVRSKIPIYQGASPVLGLYKTVDDMMYHRNPYTSFETKRIAFVNKATETRFYDAEDDRRRKKNIAHDYAAFCDGTDYFLLNTADEIKLAKEGNDFYTSIRMVKRDSRNNPNYKEQMAVGVALGIVTGVLTGMAVFVIPNGGEETEGTFQFVLNPTTHKLNMVKFLK